jgi:6-methylsalicylate decarboxylase
MRIDVHHHHTPPVYAAAVTARRIRGPVKRWSPARSLEDMDRAGVTTAVLSVTAPAVRFLGGRWARRLARACNEHTATVVRDGGGRFGMFAVLPLPDVDGTLDEIAYALDVLGADGVGLLTSYGDRLLGDAAFGPVLDELDRRGTVAFVHPATPAWGSSLLPELPASAIEWPTDTTRAIASLVFGGAAARCQNVRFVFTHGGGTMPLLAERLARLPAVRPELAERVPHGVEHELRRFHYDLAQAAHPAALRALLAVVPPSQLLFGSDFPYRTGAEHVEAITAEGLPPPDVAAIDHENALRLLPRLAERRA